MTSWNIHLNNDAMQYAIEREKTTQLEKHSMIQNTTVHYTIYYI